jgi:hypothetical protein
MPFGIGLRQVVALVRETHVLESRPAHLTVAGQGAREVAAALAAGGDATAVVVDGDPTRAAVAIYVVSGEVSPVEREIYRRITRAAVPLVVVRHGDAPVPYVLAADVVDADPELPVGELAETIARAAPDAAPGLAARLPVLRPPVQRRVVELTSWGNALIAAASRIDAPDLPLLSLASTRMMLHLGASRGDRLPHDAQGLAVKAGPPVVASLAAGLGARALVRRLPYRGTPVRAGVAYGVTRALGSARLRLP